MIVAAVLALSLQGGPVVLMGSSPGDARAISQVLGPGVSVDWVGGGEDGIVHMGPGKLNWRNRAATVFFNPELTNRPDNGFVPRLRKRLLDLKRTYHQVYVMVPNTAESSAVFAPLVRQAAREAGIPKIDFDGADSFVEAVAEVAVDQRVEKKGWRLVSFDSQQIDEGPAANAIDGRLDTYWHTQYDPTTPKPPHQITVDTGSRQSIAGFRYTPRQDGGVNGRVKGFQFFLSEDGQTWGDPVLTGEIPNTNKTTRLKFDHARTARYFRFVATSETNGGPWTTAAEIDILRARP